MVFAPGLRTVEEVRAVCDATTKPVNVLGHRGLALSEIVDAGAQRISVGGGLAFTAAAAMTDAAEAMRDAGDFSLIRRPERINEWLDS